jgi:hypothetical protein
MKKKLIIPLLVCIALHGLAQRGRTTNNRSGDPFLQTQWYLGFKGGGNLSKVISTQSYSAIEPLNYNINNTAKTYDGFKHLGGQAALVFTFYTRGFSVSFEPGFVSNIFEYSTEATWTDSEDPANTLDLSYRHRTKMNYIDFPLTFKYDLMRGNLRPFIGVGGYYSLLLNATRTIERSGTDRASGGSGPFTDDPITIGITDQFISSSIGIVGFIGASYDPGNIRIILDLGYRYGLNNITNTATRYDENQLTGIGEAMDDLKLQAMTANLSFVFPLKFIGKNFDAFN